MAVMVCCAQTLAITCISSYEQWFVFVFVLWCIILQLTATKMFYLHLQSVFSIPWFMWLLISKRFLNFVHLYFVLP